MAESWTKEVFDLKAMKEEAALDILLACFCPGISSAVARTKLDGSACVFNWCCMNVPALRNVVRTSLDIEGSWFNDCMLGFCCPCCVSIQMMREVKLDNAELKGAADYGVVFKNGAAELKNESRASVIKVKSGAKKKYEERKSKKGSNKEQDDELSEDKVRVDIKSDEPSLQLAYSNVARQSDNESYGSDGGGGDAP